MMRVMVYPFLIPFVGWCVRLLEGLVSPCLQWYTPSWFPLLDGVSAFPRVLSPLVSHCTPSCFPLLDGVSAFRSILSPLLSTLSPFLFSKQCTALGVLNAFLRFLKCLPWSCLFLSPSVSLLVSFLLVGVSTFPRSCLPFPPIASHCLPTCVPVLDHVSTFPRSCLPFSPIVSHCLHTCACVGWCVRLFDVLSRLVSPFCLPLSPRMGACVGRGLVLLACVGRCVRLPEKDKGIQGETRPSGRRTHNRNRETRRETRGDKRKQKETKGNKGRQDPREGGHTIQQKGNKKGDKGRQGETRPSGRRTHHPTPRRTP